jgi:hypothetical protein
LLDPAAADFGETRIKHEPSEQLSDQFIIFNITPPAGGGETVRANIRVHYTPQRRNNRIKLFLNDEDLSYVNTMAEREYTDSTVFLRQGDNRLLINVELGGPRVQYITVKYLD